MTIAELGSLGEFFASFGVLITLIYLAIQMRQNTKAVRLNTARALTEQLQTIFGLISANESLAEVFGEAAQHEELNGINRLRFYTLVNNFVRVYENAYLQNREQAAAGDHWDGLTRMMIDVTGMPAFHSFWEDRKHWYSDDFRLHMDTEIVPTPTRDGVNTPGHYSN